MNWGLGCDWGGGVVGVGAGLEGGGEVGGGGEVFFEGLGGFGVGPEVVVLVGVLEGLEDFGDFEVEEVVGGGLFGVGLIRRNQGDVAGGPIWSGGLGVFGVVQLCSGLFRVVRGLFGLGDGELGGLRGGLVDGLVDRWGGVGEFFGGVVIDGLGDGFGVELAGVGGAEQFAGGEAVFAQGGLERAVALLEVADQVGFLDVLEERLDGAVGVLGGEGFERLERVGGEFVDAAAEQGEVLEQGVLGGGAGEVGLVGFDGAEVVVDGGGGDVEFGGDFADGEAVLAEFVCAEGASAALGGEGHGGGLSGVRMFCLG